MIPDKIKLVIVTLALSIAGCTEKDELTLPVTINLKIGIRKQEGSFGFNEGWIGVQRIQFGGKRESGGANGVPG